MSATLIKRIQGKFIRTSAKFLFTRPLPIPDGDPLVSFTFDDFACSALRTGGPILERYGLRGTYFAALGLMGRMEAPGMMFERVDLDYAIERGHEIGSHTYDHCHAGVTRAAHFEASVARNQEAFDALFPGYALRTLAFPISEPNPAIKRRMQSRFFCCRGGGQDYNSKIADLNRLRSFFIEQSRDNPQVMYDLIEANRRDRGWLIFATHDVDPHPSPWGCTPELFESIVRRTVESGARVLPVIDAFTQLSALSAASARAASPAAELQREARNRYPGRPMLPELSFAPSGLFF